MNNEILKKLDKKELSCSVVGLGYVGLPLAVEMAKAGFKTVGFELVQEKVDMVNAGKNYIKDVKNEDLSEMVDLGMLKAVSDFSLISNMDFIAICVPTPLDSHQQPDISFVKTSTETISKYLKKDTVVVLESTTYPGTTEELLMPILEKGSGLKCGKDFYLGFSPERVDPGNAVYKTHNTPKVVGGVGEVATDLIKSIYEKFIDGGVHKVSSPKVAEMEKILENTYRNINIGLVNELAILCDKMGISIWEVVDAAKTKPYGFQAFYPSPGLGGHCIPLDPYYLSWKAREYGFHTSMIESSMIINDMMPEYTVNRVARVLNGQRKSINGSKILMLGVAYKNDIDDYRESPAIRVFDIIKKRGGEVEFFDPYIKEFKHNGKIYIGIENLTSEKLEEADIVVITTAHKVYDYKKILKHSKLIFDGRHAIENPQDFDFVDVL